MAKSKAHSDDGPSQEWMVTFSDCMTLLLTFFVMLLTYSSFDDEAAPAVTGALIDHNDPSSHAPKEPPRNHPIPPPPREIDRTVQGAEKPTHERLEPNLRPRDSLDLNNLDAYRDRRILTIPSRLLFWGQGAQLKPEGTDLLGPVAEYLRLVSSRVVIAETSADGPGREAEQRRALDRAWAVLNYLTEARELQAERFNLSTSAGPDAPDEPAVVIAVLSPEAYP
jgi:chemotaxis protein MotB